MPVFVSSPGKVAPGTAISWAFPQLLKAGLYRISALVQYINGGTGNLVDGLYKVVLAWQISSNEYAGSIVMRAHPYNLVLGAGQAILEQESAPFLLPSDTNLLEVILQDGTIFDSTITGTVAVLEGPV